MHMQYAVVYMLHVCPWILMDSATAAFGSPRGSLVMENFSAAAPKAWGTKTAKAQGDWTVQAKPKAWPWLNTYNVLRAI